MPTNALLSAGASTLAFIASVDPILTIGLPIFFFVVGKAVDVAVKIYLSKRKK